MDQRCARFVFVLALLASDLVSGQTRARVPINIPDIPGYKTLKCDFHIHTVFSDGSVWPDIRAEEAWREGLDAIAITDHIEGQPHKEDLPTHHNRSYQIARARGEALELIVIPGSEVTRAMPPGHLNTVFLSDAELLDREEWRDALRAAGDQGAFIFWNHPGWTGQESDGIGKWYSEHTELVEQGLLHGIEVVNGTEYYPEVHRWCLEKKLTMLSNSDIHNPLNLDYHVHDGEHRPVTLVFAPEKTPEAIRNALFERRTAVYSSNLLIGEERFLRPIFEESVQIKNNSIIVERGRTAYVQIHNSSDLDFRLVGDPRFEEISVPTRVVLQGGKTVLLEVKGQSAELRGRKRLDVAYTVENLKVAPNEGLPICFSIEVVFAPERP